MKLLLLEERRAKAHENTHRYSLEEFGLSGEEIHAALGPLFDRYGWDAAEPRSAEVRAEQGGR